MYPIIDFRPGVWRGVRALVLGLLVCVACAALTAARAQPAPAAAPAPFGLFPSVAAPGDPVWLTGSSGRAETGTIWVGGHPARLSRDPTSGWLTFTVPKTAAPGPQPVGGQAPPARGAAVLTVLPPGMAVEDVVLYVNPGAADDIRQQYVGRLKRLLDGCQRRCPQQLTAAIERLTSQVPFPELQPLGTAVPEPVTGRPGVRRLPAFRSPGPATPLLTMPGGNAAFRLEPLRSPAVVAGRSAGFCTQMAGLLRSASQGVPTGQVISLLTLLFAGDLSVDPTTAGHPYQTAIPYHNEQPRTVVETVLGIRQGSGAGVTIHVLDTASPTADDFTMDTPVLYYDLPPVANRPYHGRVVGEIAQAVAPDATVTLRQVCTLPGRAPGDCSTLETVNALCAVAQEARQGGRHVVNLSLGGAYPTLGLKLALREVAAVGVPTVASYGNRDDCVGHAPGDQCHHYPADWSDEFVTGMVPGSPTMLLSVAGWDIRDELQEFATYNRAVVIPWAQTPLPSVQAPGEFWSGGLPYFGTSFAAPVVSGVLAGWMSCRPGIPVVPLVTTPHQNPLASVVNACP
ncbi:MULTISPECIES: S8 family serine peptidase [Deinococcus]|uniref:S8 family serine peptidase n=1 Tax=Deinococcus rufus TaxID=2136097 RepID=A0ABV7ZF04_9DEIO|nr:S8 family serine peptidase [Deinococcus sp. AB2017081]WQE96768.1 S8 family serine peptidase [Deinococcus sp. AB2017081]